ncbi:MAG: aminoacyl-tRNA hydrolase [Gemmataceae bacterium]
MKMIVGLGNPGRRYRGTRHNLGFAVIEELVQRLGVRKGRHLFEADVAEWSGSRDKVLLVRPLTYMNLSGRSVAPLVRYYQIALADLLVICDDLHLPVGQLRVRRRGSAGGHKGLLSIEQALGSSDYPRLRIGIGSPGTRDPVAFVLDRFSEEELPVIQGAVARAADAARVWAEEGIEAAMNRFNVRAAADGASPPPPGSKDG